MRIELTRVGLLVYRANPYNTRGAHVHSEVSLFISSGNDFNIKSHCKLFYYKNILEVILL